MIGAAIYGTGNLAIHAAQGDVNSFGDGLKYFATGAVAGAIVGATWSLGLASVGTGSLINGMSFMTSTAGKIAGTTILAGKAVNAISTTASILGDNENADKIMFGKMYFDENGGHGLTQALTRYSWEGLQTWAGYNFAQFRNAFGGVDRVDYFGGATYATKENSGHHMAVSIGHNLNFYIPGTISGDFTNYVTKGNPMYMHEYGHTFDSQRYGLSYLFAIGLPSLISASTSIHAAGYPAQISTHDLRTYELRANRHAARYFKKYYGVDWLTDPYPFNPSKTIEDYYPLYK